MSKSVVQLTPRSITVEKNVRTAFGDESERTMSESLAKNGQLQPIIVRVVDGKPRLVIGERRLRAAIQAGLPTIDAVVIDRNMAVAEVLRLQLIENLAREDLNPLDIASGIHSLMQETGQTASDIAADLGLSAGSVSRYLSLLTLPESIQAQVRSGAIGVSSAHELTKVEDAGQQAQLADQLASKQLTRDGVSRASRRRKSPSVEAGAKPVRVRIELIGGRSVTVAGTGLCSVNDLIEWLQELTAKARKGRRLELATFVRLARDEAKT